MSIFRAYDIRGVYGRELTDELSEKIGRAFGTILGKGRVAVGYDVRESSPKVCEKLVEGLRAGGIDVLDVGLVPTPALYFAVYQMGLDGGVMVTASHNPGEYNGFKLLRGKSTLAGDEIKDVERIVESGRFAEGSGGYEKKDVSREYLDYITSHVKLKKSLKVVVDAGNGTAGEIAPEALRRVGCDVVELYCELDGSFPNHHPDPTVDENVRDLRKKVLEAGADVGFGFDGDSDRAGFIDDKGNIIRGDTALMLLSRDLLECNPGAKIIFDVKCSNLLTKDIKEHGGVPIMFRTGHSFIKRKMVEEDAKLAGEMSGHFFFKDNYFGYDDAIYTALRMLQFLSKQDKKLSEIVSELPKSFATPELRLSASDARKFEIVGEVVEHFKKSKTSAEVIDVDGVRLQYPDGWSLLRASNTSPKLILRFEAQDRKRLDEIKKELLDVLWQYEELAEGLCELEKQL
ncbi:MAG TPA: phosphomannomutase/phosphoglucomutase [Candidatus Altiarchaeales archaeon]|nr:phosphomannomutase/phosphoglucomutase [Candidatus Altiarchaeales archaeon]